MKIGNGWLYDKRLFTNLIGISRSEIERDVKINVMETTLKVQQ